MTLTQQKTQSANSGLPKNLNPLEGVLMDTTVAQHDSSAQALDGSALVTIGKVSCLENGGSVQKKIDLVEGRAVKDPGHKLNVWSGHYQDQAVYGLEGVRLLLKRLKANEAITLGIFGQEDMRVLKTKKELEANPRDGYVARTKDFIKWPTGNKLLLLDVDLEPGAKAITASELMAKLTKVIPALEGVGYLVTESTSSNIYNKDTGECLLGPGNFHLFLIVSGDVERFSETLKTLFWAEGMGFFKLSKANEKTRVPCILERLPVDMAVFSPERLVYEAGALLGPGLEQRRAKPVVVPGGILDLDSIFATAEQTQKAEENKAKAHKTILKTRKAQVTEFVTKETGLPEAEVKAIVKDRIAKCEKCELEPDHPIYLKDGTEVLAGDLAKEHHRLDCKDPQDPGYDGGRFCAQVLLGAGGIRIHSFAHGDKNYSVLPREPKAGDDGAKPKTKIMKLWDRFEAAFGASVFYNQRSGMPSIAGEACDLDVLRNEFIRFTNEDMTVDLFTQEFMAWVKDFHAGDPDLLYLKSLPEMGVSEAQALFTQLAEVMGLNDPYDRNMLMKHRIGRVARVYKPGCFMQWVLVLKGAGACGKSSYFESYGQDLTGTYSMKNDHLSKGSPTPDAQRCMLLASCVSLDEIEFLAKRAFGSLKSTISQSHIHHRFPYDRAMKAHRLRFVWGATANGESPLQDDGAENRRYVVLAMPGDKLDGPRRAIWYDENRHHLNAAAKALYLAGVDWNLDDVEKEAQSVKAESHIERSGIYYEALNGLKTLAKHKAGAENIPGLTLEQLEDLFNKKHRDLYHHEKQDVRKALKDTGWVCHQVSRDGVRYRFWCPEGFEKTQITELASLGQILLHQEWCTDDARKLN
jgi:hypothetical protein